jgi:hypothetical protein
MLVIIFRKINKTAINRLTFINKNSSFLKLHEKIIPILPLTSLPAIAQQFDKKWDAVIELEK